MSLDAIRRFVRHPDCVIFAGSGLSVWSGLPSWTGLLKELADYLDLEGLSSDLVRREIRNGDLLQAASYGVSRLTPASFAKFIRQATQVGKAAPHAIHKALVELGPTSFITTNYDTLIEQALSLWRSDAYFSPVITNKHLVELAEVVSARSSHFVFKPHGDIGDASSIVLTREQYRLLLPGGERHTALESLRTLLITRPVLYVGFGLRDPDFVYLRDLLLNIYQGTVRDHWAIMPDVSSDEADYWRNQYGIRLHGYTTTPTETDGRNHGELLSLLQILKQGPDEAIPSHAPIEPSSGIVDAETTLALTRYASGLALRTAPNANPIDVRVSSATGVISEYSGIAQYDGWTIARFLNEGPDPAYLVGLPGAGKSFSLKLAVHRLADRLQHACLDDTLLSLYPTIPFFVDLKLYRGSLQQLIDAQLPPGLDLAGLHGDLPIKLFLDAFNEMPSSYLENGALFEELEKLASNLGPFSYVISSRTRDGLSINESVPIYELDTFDIDHVEQVLKSRGVILHGPFAQEVTHLLSRPFFLQLLVKGLVEVPSRPRPRDIFRSFFDKLQVQFEGRFGSTVDVTTLLTQVAFRVMEAGTEAFPTSWIEEVFAASPMPDAGLEVGDVLNWLVGREILIPFTGHKVAFVHQSLTEFLGSSELARRSQIDSVSLREVIRTKRWDQCLFLALALLETAAARAVLRDAIQADLRLAINAVRYAEEGQSDAVREILTALIGSAGSRSGGHMFLSLRNLPVGPEHVLLLRQIVSLRDSLGGEAVLLVAGLLGPSYKAELLRMLEDYGDHYNFAVNGVAPALEPMLDEADIPELLRIGEKWVSRSDDDDGCSSVSKALSRFDADLLVRSLPRPLSELPDGLVKMIASALRERDDLASFRQLSALLLSHPNTVASSFALATYPGKEDAEERFSALQASHIEALWKARFSEELWDAGIRRVCKQRPDLTDQVIKMAGQVSGIEAIALNYCANVDQSELRNQLVALLDLDDAALRNEPVSIFNLRQLDWRGLEPLLARSLARDVPELRRALVDDPPRSGSLLPASLGISDLKPAITVAASLGREGDDWWIRRKIGELVAGLGNDEVKELCIGALTSGSEALKRWVKETYLSNAEGLTTDSLQAEVVSDLLADLDIPSRINEHWYNPLGALATERFVQERLLPLAENAPAHFRENLTLVLRRAGDRLGKRFIFGG